MKNYTDLTQLGKLRRLHELVEVTLANYDLDHPQPDYHGWYTNLLYRVTTASGERFMLRLAAPGWRTFEDLYSEALWLDALSRETTLLVPRIIPARSGEYVLPMSGPGIPKVWNASLMSWVPGRQLKHYLTPCNLEMMGELFAELHHHGAAWIPPADFTTRRFEHWLSRGEENLLFGDGRSAPLAMLPVHWRELLEHLHHHVEQAYSDLDRSDLRVIHCDLWHENIKIYHGRLHPIDFEYTVWGFRAHDIAMAMLDLLEATDDLRYQKLLSAFRAGYEAHLSWPVELIEPFQIGRLLWKINWFARFRPQRLFHLVETHVPVFEHFLQTGRVTQPPAVVF